jgi:putative sporulation protein YtaF
VPHVVSLLVLALAVSLDGFGVGAMYGLRKIRIPVVSVLIIAAVSGLVFFLSMQIGVAATAFLSPQLAKIAGAVILMAIGCWAVYQMLSQQRSDEEDRRNHLAQAAAVQADERQNGLTESARVVSIELKRLGLVIQILKTPAAADIDRSGTISAMEAAWLGIALSLDAFGAGIGAAFIGYTPIVTSAIIAISSGSFIYCGLRVGFMYSNVQWIRRLSVLPGCILILMGFLKLM